VKAPNELIYSSWVSGFARVRALIHLQFADMKPAVFLEVKPTMYQAKLSLLGLGLAICLAAAPTIACAQDGTDLIGANWRDRDLWRELWNPAARSNDETSPANRAARCRLFRMPSAYPETPVNIGPDSDAGGSDPNSTLSPEKDSDLTADGRLVAALGNDNPFLDFRRPGDPGGVGFARFHSQYLLVEGRSLGISVGLQAVRPAGLESDGAAEGQTVLSPNVAWFYDLGSGTAIHGFVGKNLNARSGWSDDLERDIRYGLALQSPVPYLANNPGRGLHVFVEALGNYKYDTDQGAAPNLEIVPGLHWKLKDSWWMSGAFLLPVNAPRPENRLWQLTCAWQF
jgi:hypothetical protein